MKVNSTTYASSSPKNSLSLAPQDRRADSGAAAAYARDSAKLAATDSASISSMPASASGRLQPPGQPKRAHSASPAQSSRANEPPRQTIRKRASTMRCVLRAIMPDRARAGVNWRNGCRAAILPCPRRGARRAGGRRLRGRLQPVDRLFRPLRRDARRLRRPGSADPLPDAQGLGLRAGDRLPARTGGVAHAGFARARQPRPARGREALPGPDRALAERGGGARGLQVRVRQRRRGAHVRRRPVRGADRARRARFRAPGQPAAGARAGAALHSRTASSRPRPSRSCCARTARCSRARSPRRRSSTRGAARCSRSSTTSPSARRRRQRFRYIETHDPRTGLPNRATLRELLAAAHRGARSTACTCCWRSTSTA